MEDGLPFSKSFWVQEPLLLAGAFPADSDVSLTREKIEALVRCGIRHVVNLTEADEVNYYGLPFVPYEPILEELSEALGAPITNSRHPIGDMGVPTRHLMKTILDEIDAHLARRTPVYLHCWGGHGRTGTVVGCYLARHGLAHGDQALEMIRDLRKHEAMAQVASPQTEAQRRMVRDWKAGE